MEWEHHFDYIVITCHLHLHDPTIRRLETVCIEGGNPNNAEMVSVDDYY